MGSLTDFPGYEWGRMYARQYRWSFRFNLSKSGIGVSMAWQGEHMKICGT